MLQLLSLATMALVVEEAMAKTAQVVEVAAAAVSAEVAWAAMVAEPVRYMQVEARARTMAAAVADVGVALAGEVEAGAAVAVQAGPEGGEGAVVEEATEEVAAMQVAKARPEVRVGASLGTPTCQNLRTPHSRAGDGKSQIPCLDVESTQTSPICSSHARNDNR